MNRHLWTLRAFLLRYQHQCMLVAGASVLLLLVLIIGWSGQENPAPREAVATAPAAEEAPAAPETSVAAETSATAEVRDAAPPSDSLSPDSSLSPGSTPSVQDNLSVNQSGVIQRGGAAHTQARVALIIDDLGNSAEAGQRAIALPASITFAVLPHTPHGRSLAEHAYASGREVMLHAPMSNTAGMPLGEGGLTPDMSEEEFTDTLLAALADIPHARGVNNHTGSELTTLPEQMAWVMQTLKPQGLYFVDSVTTAGSVAADVATEHQIPNTRRQVFLDNSADPEDIHFEFERLLAIAERDGYAVGIGHPYPQTLDYLEAVLPSLVERGFELVFVSQLIEQKAESKAEVPARKHLQEVVPPTSEP